MAMINLKSELSEISEYLSSVGVPEGDHYLILDKLKVDQEAHLRYLKSARAAKAKH